MENDQTTSNMSKLIFFSPKIYAVARKKERERNTKTKSYFKVVSGGKQLFDGELLSCFQTGKRRMGSIGNQLTPTEFCYGWGLENRDSKIGTLITLIPVSLGNSKLCQALVNRWNCEPQGKIVRLMCSLQSRQGLFFTAGEIYYIVICRPKCATHSNGHPRLTIYSSSIRVVCLLRREQSQAVIWK